MVFAFQISVYQIRQQLLEYPCSILHLPLQSCHDQRCHITSITHGERPGKIQIKSLSHHLFVLIIISVCHCCFKINFKQTSNPTITWIIVGPKIHMIQIFKWTQQLSPQLPVFTFWNQQTIEFFLEKRFLFWFNLLPKKLFLNVLS